MTASSASELRCMSKHHGKRQQLPRHKRQQATLHRGRTRWTAPTDGPTGCEEVVHTSPHFLELHTSQRDSLRVPRQRTAFTDVRNLTNLCVPNSSCPR